MQNVITYNYSYFQNDRVLDCIFWDPNAAGTVKGSLNVSTVDVKKKLLVQCLVIMN